MSTKITLTMANGEKETFIKGHGAPFISTVAQAVEVQIRVEDVLYVWEPRARKSWHHKTVKNGIESVVKVYPRIPAGEIAQFCERVLR